MAPCNRETIYELARESDLREIQNKRSRVASVARETPRKI